MVSEIIEQAQTFLFVPGNKPALFEKAAATDADVIILDLEDAVAPGEKAVARSHVAEHGIKAKSVVVRINAAETPYFSEDVATLKGSNVEALMVPKAEDPEVFSTLSQPVVALVESGLGVANARTIAAHPLVHRLAFGSIDFAADMGCAETFDALLLARSELVLASRLAGIAAPIDGVTANLSDESLIKRDAAKAKELGFSGKLLIHPKQVELVRSAMRPSDAEIKWAEKILNAVSSADASAVAVDGEMVDRPVILRAQKIIRESK